MATVYLALGSNLGDRRLYIEKAVKELNASHIHVQRLSKIIETNPVGGPLQGKYLNAVLKVQTDHSPERLLEVIQSIEYKLGRIRKEVNGPRVIDIDILLYDDIKLVSRRLMVPHPRMYEREFVMKPLKEVYPHADD